MPSLAAHKRPKRLLKSISDNNVSPTTTESPLMDHGNHTSYGSSAENSPDCQNETRPAEGVKKAKFRDAFTRPIILTLLNHAFLAFLDMCYAVLLPLMYSTSIQNGGLGLDPSRIGAALGAFGLINSIVQLNFLGRCIRKFGPRTVYTVSFRSFFVLFSMYGITKFFAQRAGEVDHIVVACMIFQLCCQMFIFAAYGEWDCL